MRVDATIREAIDGFLEWKPNGASLAEIYDAVERLTDRAKRPSIRRVLQANSAPQGDRYVRVRRGVYALGRFHSAAARDR
jgi:hypothetical protein